MSQENERQKAPGGSPLGASAGRGSGLTAWRSQHRSRSHDSAHAEVEHAPAARVIDHPLVPSGAASVIADQSALDELIDSLRAAGSFAYDTEFIGELTYHPILCLIQVATTKTIALIDPMVELDLQRFWELLADPAVEKIVHAGEQDVEPVARHLAGTGEMRGAKNVADTQIVAGFAGMAYPVALSKLVLERLGVKLGKGATFTHWDLRPLSASQLRYAADDVRYLPALWDALRKRIDTLGHREWATAECEEMCDPARFGFKADASYLRIRGAGSLSASGLAILRELSIWRDKSARLANAPQRALVKDDVLIDLSRSPIKSIDKLARVRGLPRPVERDHGQEIIDATLRALASPMAHDRPERFAEPSPTERFRADSLFAAASAICAARSIDPALVTSRQEIADFYRAFIRDPSGQELEALDLMRGWRRHALGQPLLRFLAGEPPEQNQQFIWRDGRLQSGRD